MKKFPEIIELELTSKCNKKCRVCQRQFIVSEYNDDLNVNTLKIILLQIEKRKCQINLGGLGESLLVSNLCEILGLIKSHNPNILTGINTNGVLLTEDKYSWLTDGRLDFFTISINAPDYDGYHFITDDVDYDIVCTNAMNFLKVKGKNNKPHTTVHCFNIPHFWGKIEDFKNKWERFADFVQIRDLTNWAGTVPVEKFGVEARLNGICERPFVSIAIDTNGTYHNCCGSFYLDKSTHNINDISIEDFWNSDTLQHFRKIMRNGTISPDHTCFNCSAKSISPNTLIERNTMSNSSKVVQ